MVLGRYEEDEAADTSKTWYWCCQNWFSPLLFPWCLLNMKWYAIMHFWSRDLLPLLLFVHMSIINEALRDVLVFHLFSWLKKYLYICRPWLYISFYHLVAVLVFMYSDIVFFSVNCMLKFWCRDNLLKYQVAWWCGGLDIRLAVERLYCQLTVEALLCKLSQPSLRLCKSQTGKVTMRCDL